MKAILLLWMILLMPAIGAANASGTGEDPLVFEDFPLKDLIEHPSWFKESFLELKEDLEEAVTAGKQGIIVYFGQKRCAYCKMLMKSDFGDPEISKYTREHFDVIAIDIWSPETVTLPDGTEMSQADYAARMKTNFTPSLIFYDRDGKIALRLRGYYPPYQFRAALEYVADEHYKRETLAVYMARGDSTLRFEAEDLVEEDFFLPPPYNLDRSRFPADRPLVVFFEEGNCHACDILHTEPLRQELIRKRFRNFDSVQLDMHSTQPVITPSGEKTTAAEWAKQLGIFYAPSLVFFDERGKEIIRVDSVVHLFRLRGVLNYITAKGYLTFPTYQRWRAGATQP